jgi:hypothetical protein
MRIDLFNSAASEIVERAELAAGGEFNNAKTGQSDGEDRATLTSDSTSVGSLVSTA